MAATVAESIAKMEESFAAENLPPGAVMVFAKQVRKATGTLMDKRQIQCRVATKAGEHQDKLGPSAILRGHHRTAWMDATFRTYRKQVYPPGTNKKHKRKDKTALELSSVLAREC